MTFSCLSCHHTSSILHFYNYLISLMNKHATEMDACIFYSLFLKSLDHHGRRTSAAVLQPPVGHSRAEETLVGLWTHGHSLPSLAGWV